MKLTLNIHTALPVLMSLYPGKAWWIDAICINQADIEEKNDQVPMMRDIYMIAKRVVAWLGDITPNLQLVIEEMSR